MSPTAWPSVSLSFLKLSMSSSPIASSPPWRSRRARLDVERLHQAAPVGDLGQHVGGDLVGQAPQLALERLHAGLELGGALAAFVAGAPACSADQRRAPRGSPRPSARTTPARLSSESALRDRVDVARHAVGETAGVVAQRVELGEHLRDRVLERRRARCRVPRAARAWRARVCASISLAARTERTLGDVAQAAAAGSRVWPLTQLSSSASSARPALSLQRQPVQLVDQVVAMRQQPARALAQRLGLRAQLGAVAPSRAEPACSSRSSPASSMARVVVRRAARTCSVGVVLLRAPAASRRARWSRGRRRRAPRRASRSAAPPAAAPVSSTSTSSARARRASAARVDRDRVVGDVAVPRRHELPHALVQPRDVAAVGLQHALQAVLLARRRPLAAAALQAARELLDGLGEPWASAAAIPRRARPGRARRPSRRAAAPARTPRAACRPRTGAPRRVVDVLASGWPPPARRGGAGRRGRRAALLRPGAGVVLGRGLQLGQRQAAQRGLGGLGGRRFRHGRCRAGGRWAARLSRAPTDVDDIVGARPRLRAPAGRSTAPCAAGRSAPSSAWRSSGGSGSAEQEALHQRRSLGRAARPCCRRFSTPSATTLRPSDRASAMMAVTTARLCGVHAEVAHEAAVDLDLGDRQRRQVGQRRIAGAEVVDRDLHADLVEPVQRRDHALQVLHQARLGDLELDHAVRNAVVAHALARCARPGRCARTCGWAC